MRDFEFFLWAPVDLDPAASCAVCHQPLDECHNGASFGVVVATGDKQWVPVGIPCHIAGMRDQVFSIH